jgi:ketosteroid isomerase-like protein
MSDQSVDLLRSWVDAFNRRDFDALAALDHPEIEWQTSSEDPDAAVHRGSEALQRYLDGYIEAFPDLSIEVTECVAVGDNRVFATNRFVGRSATGVPMDWILHTVSTLEGGLFVRTEEYFDRAEALESAGLPSQ